MGGRSALPFSRPGKPGECQFTTEPQRAQRRMGGVILSYSGSLALAFTQSSERLVLIVYYIFPL
jgi:hypothetical protein